MDHRDYYNMIAEILELALKGNFKTPIMKKANIDSRVASQYFPLLLKNNLLTSEMMIPEVIYRTTEKGKDFLRTYHSLEKKLLIK